MIKNIIATYIAIVLSYITALGIDKLFELRRQKKYEAKYSKHKK